MKTMANGFKGPQSRPLFYIKPTW